MLDADASIRFSLRPRRRVLFAIEVRGPGNVSTVTPAWSGSEPPSQRRLAWVAGASAAVLVLCVGGTPQSLYSDPAWQVKAVQQYLDGVSPSPNHLVQPSPADLSRDRSRWISWWAPSTSFLVWPLMGAGLSAGLSLRFLAAGSLLVGSVGWALWIGIFRLPLPTALFLAALFPWMRYASNVLFLYSAEALVYAAAPWMLLAARRYVQRAATEAREAIAFPVGLLLGSAYLLKYSLVFLSLGAVGFVVAGLLRRPAHSRARGVAALTLGFSLPILGLQVFGYWAGSTATPVSASPHLNLSLRNVAYIVAAPALAAADAGALWRWLLLHPVHGVTSDSLWVALIGVPGGLCLWCLVAKPSSEDPAVGLGRAVLFASAALLFAAWTVSGHVSHESRHLAGAALAILPLAIARGLDRRRGAGPALRAALGLAGVFYVAAPLAYGVVSVAGKVARTPRDYVPAGSGIYNPLFAPADAQGAVARLLEHLGGANTLWYLPEPLTALDLPVRAIIRHAEFLSADDLRAERFTTKEPLRLRLLLPPAMEADGRAAIIRSSFRHAGPWRRETIEGCRYAAWTAPMEPAGTSAAARRRTETAATPQGGIQLFHTE